MAVSNPKTNSGIPSEEEKFNLTLTELLDITQEIIEELNSQKKTNIETGLLLLASGFLASFKDKTKIIEGFIKHSFNYWEKIRIKDESFFVNNCNQIFEGFMGEHAIHLNAFKELFDKRLISTDQKNIIWDYFHSMVRISIKYVHRIRGPYSDVETTYNTPSSQSVNSNSKGSSVPVGITTCRKYYQNNKFEEIKLGKISREWEMELIFPQFQ